jgi:hypothetical protein
MKSSEACFRDAHRLPGGAMEGGGVVACKGMLAKKTRSGERWPCANLVRQW